MRPNNDFFSLTGLPFDPPEKSQRQVEKAIAKAMSRIQAKLCLNTQQLQREVFQAQLDFLNQQSILINTTGWMEASKHFVELAAKRKKQEYERVQFTASLLVQNGIRSLDKGIFRSFRVKTGLSVETLTQVLEKSGIDLLPGASIDKLPHFPTNGERIQIELEELRETKDPNPNGPDTSRVTDLYIFAAYLMDDLEHADLYKNLSTSELKTVFDLAARKYSCRNDNLGKLCGSIASLASHYVFNSDNNRKGYEALMLYHHVALQSLFDALKILPSGILLQPGFAEKCIKLICVFFPDYETALSIYNKEGNLTEVPYIPRENADSSVDDYREDKNVTPKCRIYGIDLGTTYSAIATLDDNGMPEVISNQDEGSDLLASAVYFHDEANVVVGEYAKSQKDIKPERVVEFVKRYIGKPDAPTYEFDGVKYDPITISALILKRMKAYADAQGHCVENVVITCPAHFGSDEKAATRQAGIIAGLNVMNIVHEPTAAALNYCAREFNENRKIMVYDLGGGTFDITLFDFSVDDSGKALIEVIKTGGNDRLGGIDWDARMFDYMSQKYAFEIGTEVSDMHGELKAIIRAQVEQAKKDLSILEKKSYTIKYDGDRTRIELTRQEFENLTQDLVQQTMDYVHQLLSDVNFTPTDVDVVLLVGGSTLMPMIKNAVEAVFPGKVRVEQPHLAVAKGAALSAAIEWYEFERIQTSGEI